MKSKAGSWCLWESINLFLLLPYCAIGHIIHEFGSDDIMDAFAEDSNICKNDISDKVIFCRYMSGGRLQVFEINPCLCTHILLDFGTTASDIKKFAYLRSLNHRLQILGSIPIDLSNLTISSQNLTAWVSNSQIDGLDFLLQGETFFNDTNLNQIVSFIKEINNLLKKSGVGQSKILMLTLMESTLMHLPKIFSEDHFRHIDFMSIIGKGETDPSTSQNSSLTLQSLLENIPKKKMLIPLNIRHVLESLVTQQSRRENYFQEICTLLANDDFKNISIETRKEKGQELMDFIVNKTQLISQDGYAGFDVDSLNEDHYLKFCGEKQFPVLNLIQNALKDEKPHFNAFKDLDIALSTGESQIVGEIQLLPQQSINSKPLQRFKCDKIGFFRHPADCTKFYHCSEYRAPRRNNNKEYAIFVYKCPRGLVYDEFQGSCNWPSHSEPCQGSSELTPVAPKKFQCTKPGFHADSKDCRWFYYCLDLGDGTLTAFEFLCPSHLLGFDEKKLLCNWKWTVPACESHTPTEGAVYSTSAQVSSSNSPERGEEYNFKHSEAPRNGFHGVNSFEQTIPSQLTDINTPRKPLINTDIYIPLEHKIDNNTPEDQTSVALPLKEDKFSTRTPEVISLQIENKGPAEKITLKDTVKNSEKSYGRAVWHRSMINKDRQTADHNSRALDRLIEQIKNSRTVQNSDVEFNGDQKRGIGTVTKIVPKVHQPETDVSRPHDKPLNVRQHIAPFQQNQPNTPKIIPFVPVNSQGRSVGTDDENEIKYNVESQPDTDKFSPRPFANVKCSKTLENSVDFGCIGEVSLVVNVKSGVDADKFVIKDEQLSRSAHQGTEQVVQIVKNNESDSLKLDLIQNNETYNKLYDNKPQDATSLYTQGRSVSSGNNKNLLPKALSITRNADIGNKVNSTDDSENSSVVENSFATEDTLNRNLLKTSTARTDSTLKDQIKLEKEEEVHTKSKEGVMSINFYAQGVLLNVFLSHMNEIPPQTLIEVDKMLKKFMKDGQINIKFLEDKLNASTEGMSREMNVSKMSSVEDMIDMLEKMINSTTKAEEISSTENSYETETTTGNLSQTTETSVNENATGEDTKVDKEKLTVETTTFMEDSLMKINEENITNYKKNLTIDSPHSNNNRRLSPILLNKNVLENNRYGNNAPFVRRRLIRKFKLPSIKEQLELQNKYRNTENEANLDTESPSPLTKNSEGTSVESKIPKRPKFPSIREQLENQRHNLASKISKQSDLVVNPKNNFYGGEIKTNLNGNINYDDEPNQYGERIRVANYEGNDHLHAQDRLEVSSPKVSFNPDLYLNRNEWMGQRFHNLSSDRTTPQQSNPKEYPRDEINIYGIDNRNERRFPADQSQFYYKLPIQPNPYESGNPDWRPENSYKESAERGDPLPEISLNGEQNIVPQLDTGKHFNLKDFNSRLDSNDNRRRTTDANYRRRTTDSNYRKQAHDDNHRRQTLDESIEGYKKQVSEYNYGRRGNGNNDERHTSYDNYDNKHHDTDYKTLAIDYTKRRIFDETVRSQTSDHFTERQTSHSPGTYPFGEVQRPQTINNTLSGQAYNDFSRTYLNHDSNRRPIDYRNGYITDNLEKDTQNFDPQRITNNGNSESIQNNFDFHPSQTSGLANNPQTFHNFERTDNFDHINPIHSIGQHTNPIVVVEKRKKRRKLRILVKKRHNNDFNRNQEHQPVDGKMKIPKHLLTELKSTLLKKLESEGKTDVELQIRFQDNVWNIPFVDDQRDQSMSPVICTRAGLFHHPKDCNMFYECFWDKWLNKFTLHVFSCPVKLVYDNSIRGCSRPSLESSCSNSIS